MAKIEPPQITETPTSVPGDEPAGYRWPMLALNWLLYFSFGVAASSTGALAVDIARDLHLDPTQMGTVLGAWQLAYIGTSFAAGMALDRYGLRRGMAVGGLVVALSALLRSYADGFGSLALAVGLFGVGGPLISVGSNKVVSEWFRGSQRGAAMGIAVTGPTVGSVAVLALANSVLVPLTGSWRGALVVCAGVSVLAATAWTAFSREAPRHLASARMGEHRIPIQKTIAYLVRVRNVRLIMIGAITTFTVSHGLTNWIPTILVDRGFTKSEAGLLAAGATALGLLSSLMLPRSVASGRRRFLLAGVCATAAFAIMGLALNSGTPLIVALAVAGLCRAGTGPLMMLLLMETPGIGPNYTGAAAGLYFMFGEIGGFSGPFLIGALKTITGSFAAPLVILSMLPLLMSGLALRLSEGTDATPPTDAKVAAPRA